VFIGMGMLPAIEPAAAAEELERVVGELGMAGGVLPATGLPEPLGAKRYLPIYETADRLGCALSVHGGNHSRLGLDHMNVFAPVNALGHPFSQLIAFASIVFNGVMDRFPGLRLGFLEGGAAWLSLALERFDRAYETQIPLDPRGEQLRLDPGESVSDRLAALAAAGRFFYGCEGDEPAVADVAARLGTNVALFSTDFPHESNAERCVHEIEELVERDDCDEQAKTDMLWRNAARFYGGDHGELAEAGASAILGATT
jgi:predicted TIM-barrel fold metal-dependent hydrolase